MVNANISASNFILQNECLSLDLESMSSKERLKFLGDQDGQTSSNDFVYNSDCLHEHVSDVVAVNRHIFKKQNTSTNIALLFIVAQLENSIIIKVTE